MNTIEKLRAALEALEDEDFDRDTRKAHNTILDLRSVIAEMESAEPVAWRLRFGKSTIWTVYEYQPTQSMFGKNIEVQPLYPQPKAEPAVIIKGDV